MIISRIHSLYERLGLKFFPSSSINLRVLVHLGRYKEVVDSYEKGSIDIDQNSGTVGYCYYQLSNFKEAIIHLQKALQTSPTYYSRLFLAISLRALNRDAEAIDQLLQCLKLHPKHNSETLNHLLLWTAQITDKNISKKIFTKIDTAIENSNLSNLDFAKLLFYQKRDNEISPQMIEGLKLCRFYDAKHLTSSGNGQYLPLGIPEKLRFIYLNENRDDVWVNVNPPYVAEIYEATVIHNSSLILVQEEKILSDLLANKDYGKFVSMQYDSNVIAHRDDALLIKRPTPDTEIAEGIMLSGLASSAYGHWFAEFLPKLRFLEKHPNFSRFPIIVDEGMPQSHYDFLSILASNPIYRLAKGSSLKVRNLLVANTDFFFPTELVRNHSVPPEHQSSLTVGALEYIGVKITKHFGAPKNPKDRIFLSRRNCQWRKLENEKQIIDMLQEFNFKTVYIEDFSFKDQVKIFQNSEFIVAPNGSSLNNLIFSSPKVKLLMLGQKNLFNWGGWFGSFKELGYSITYLAGDPLGDKKAKHSSYIVSASTVRTKVIEMLNSQ